MVHHGLHLGLGRRQKVAGGASGPSHDSAASAYFAAMSVQPDATRKGHLNTLIAGLKADGIWTKLDWLAICAAHDEQAGRVNAVNPAQVATAPVAPTFTTDRGFTGNGTTQYLDSGWNPVTAGSPKFVQNDAHMGVWCGTDATAFNYCDVGYYGRSMVVARSGTNLSTYPNAAGGATAALSPATSVGHSLWTRRGAASVEMYKAGASIGTSTIASAAPLSANFFICAGSSGGAPAGFSPRRIQAVHWGSQLSGSEAAALYGRLAAYMTAVGA